MDGVQLLQGYRATTRRQFAFYNKVPSEILETWKAALTLEPPSGFEHRNPGLVIQHLGHRSIKIP